VQAERRQRPDSGRVEDEGVIDPFFGVPVIFVVSFTVSYGYGSRRSTNTFRKGAAEVTDVPDLR
jgi:hypothetical protein